MSTPIVEHVPHLRCVAAYHLEAEHARMVGQIALETGNSLPSPGLIIPGTIGRIPVVGIDSGAIPGTRPDRLSK